MWSIAQLQNLVAVQYEIVSAINKSEEASIAVEQGSLDKHDEVIEALSVCIQ